MNEEHPQQEAEHKGNWHDRYYKILLLIPAILLLISLFSIYSLYKDTGEILNRDITLKGGTSITVFSEINLDELRTFLTDKFEDFNLRQISNLRTREQEAVIIEVTTEPEEAKQILEEFLGFPLNEENSSIEFTGSSLSEGFYKQLRIAIILAFILMSIVVFIIFRKIISSFAVIFSAFSDIVMSLALVNFLGMRLSAAGIVAFLMIIGYSVDSNILLTTRVLKRREESLNTRIFSAFKTGITMTLTSLAAVLVSLFVVSSLSNTLTQIFTILAIGLFFDLINTWVMNLGLLKWYVLNKRGES